MEGTWFACSFVLHIWRALVKSVYLSFCRIQQLSLALSAAVQWYSDYIQYAIRCNRYKLEQIAIKLQLTERKERKNKSFCRHHCVYLFQQKQQQRNNVKHLKERKEKKKTYRTRSVRSLTEQNCYFFPAVSIFFFSFDFCVHSSAFLLLLHSSEFPVWIESDSISWCSI